MKSSRVSRGIFTLAILSLVAAASLSAADLLPDFRGAEFVSFSNFASFSSTPAPGGEIFLTSPEIGVHLAADEAILSWNFRPGPGMAELSLRADYASGRASPYFIMGRWTAENSDGAVRESVARQTNAFGWVETDTLRLSEPARRFQIRLRLAKEPARRLKFLGLSARQRGSDPPPLPRNRRAWGRSLNVPAISQLWFPGGSGWCSPASVAMDLQFWSEQTRNPALKKSVPEVAAGVYDRVWGGTGNWPFNAAYAGALPSLRAYVTRFTDVAELEDWISDGVPVIASVSLRLLRGQTPPPEDGHLVVCAGFSAGGDVCICDPGSRREIRKTIPRQQFDRAWQASHRTVYLIYPRGHPAPANRFHHWE